MKKLKYIFITGGVISGLGKGIVASSLALLLEQVGYVTSPIKADPYLNLDAGTMNPVIHGETFVTEDALETDQDIGHYERFLNRNLSKLNYMTSGQIFMQVIQNERAMKYRGECVEFARHIPEEILRRLKLLGQTSKSDIIILEIGGTVGDIQNELFLEAVRQLKFSHPKDVVNVHVAYLPFPKNLGELKSKPVQQSVHFLLESGVLPDIIITRSEKEIDEVRKEKISVFCSVAKEDIISCPDLSSVYLVPDYLKKQNIIKRVIQKLSLKKRKEDITFIDRWDSFVTCTASKKSPIRIGIVGKYFKSGDYSLEDSYVSVMESLKQSFYWHGFKPQITWVSSEEIEKAGTSCISTYDGLIVPQGWGSRGAEGLIATASFARMNKVPYLGLCFGMQLASISIARDLLNLKIANSTEINPSTPHPVIHIMPNQKKYLLENKYGGTIRLGAWPSIIKKDTLLWKAYNDYKTAEFKLPQIYERHRHRYEFNQEYKKDFEKMDVVFSAMSPDGKLVEALELSNHPFFLGVQYHPEYKSRSLAPHPIFMTFIDACFNHAQKK